MQQGDNHTRENTLLPTSSWQNKFFLVLFPLFLLLYNSHNGYKYVTYVTVTTSCNVFFHMFVTSYIRGICCGINIEQPRTGTAARKHNWWQRTILTQMHGIAFRRKKCFEKWRMYLLLLPRSQLPCFWHIWAHVIFPPWGSGSCFGDCLCHDFVLVLVLIN